MRLRLLFALLAALLLTAAFAGPAVAQDASALFDSAYAAWDAGDYPVALERLERLLDGRGADEVLAHVAVLTGERYHTLEVATHGASPRWSPDGRHAAYDLPEGSPGADPEAGPRTIVVAIDDGALRTVAELDGYGAVFSPDGDRIAWLSENPAGHTRVRVRDLAGGTERDVTASEPVSAVVWSGGEVVPWVADEDVRVSPTGTHLVYSDDDGLAVLAIGTGWQRTFAGASSPAFSADGSALAFISRNDDEGYALHRLRLAGADSDARLPETLLATGDALANPAVSGDGAIVAFQRMGRENYEVWLAGAVVDGGEADGRAEAGAPADAGAPRRLTHDVQHDLYPAFLAGDRLLVIKGEGRHRRSYVYPVSGGADSDPAIREWVPGLGEGMRLFHNNTIRTVAPEYDWAVSPDGTMVLIVSERDGDTISPERGVYLTDLGRPVTLDEVRARVSRQLADERDLRERGQRTFEPVAEAVRAAVDEVSVPRIHGYQADLFRFGSKHITQPGNALAIDYLVERLRAFGYEPELQWFEPRPGLRSANVVARLRGTAYPDVVYVVGSHFDSVERGPGADDNSSGTAALLEAARVLAERPRPATIELVFFTGEEAGLLGSREFARRAIADGKDVAAALNNDMVGYANDHRLDNTIRYSSDRIRDLQHAAAFLFTDLILYDAHYYKFTDAHALYDAFGDVIGGIGSYPILANPHYHRAHDVVETIDHRLVAEVSKATIAAIMRMAEERRW